MSEELEEALSFITMMKNDYCKYACKTKGEYCKNCSYPKNIAIIKSALERLGKSEKVWKPIKEYFKEQHDWVLVQFKEKKTGFLPIPKVCEYRKHIGLWFTQEDNKVMQCYLNESCEAVAFMEIPEYKEMQNGSKSSTN